MIYSNFLESVGNTPLIKLRKASELTGCNILGKAEFLNPGGSVKDRAAKAIIMDAEQQGQLRPGDWLLREQQETQALAWRWLEIRWDIAH